MKLGKLSQELLNTCKLGNCSESKLRELKSITREQVRISLKNDTEKKAFWINLYNAFILKELGNGEMESGFFSRKRIQFQDFCLSFDDIEHNILRKGKSKWTLGLVKKTSSQYNDLMVEELDVRIHFALNCGANSCPPISSYTPDNLSTQLDEGTIEYLKESSDISRSKNKIRVPRLFLWYIGDFGGFGGIRKLYKEYRLIPVDSQPRISFLDYDWSLNIDNFATDFKE